MPAPTTRPPNLPLQDRNVAFLSRALKMPSARDALKRNLRRAATLLAEDIAWGDFMLRWAFFFLVISLIAALFGFTGIAVAAAGIAKVLFFLFLVITLVLLVLAFSAGRALR